MQRYFNYDHPSDGTSPVFWFIIHFGSSCFVNLYSQEIGQVRGKKKSKSTSECH